MARKSDFNMSAEVRNLLGKNATMSGPEVFAALSKKFPGKKINKGSCNVAFAMARKKLGLTGRGTGDRIYGKVGRPDAETVSLSALRSARELLNQTNGDISLANAILKEVKLLQS